MAEYIDREDAATIADYAVDEHPYDKNPEKPETFSEYNQGWHDACDYVRDKLEQFPAADVAPVRHGRWEDAAGDMMEPYYKCSVCEWAYAWWEPDEALYCPSCGAKMDGGTDNGE